MGNTFFNYAVQLLALVSQRVQLGFLLCEPLAVNPDFFIQLDVFAFEFVDFALDFCADLLFLEDVTLSEVNGNFNALDIFPDRSHLLVLRTHFAQLAHQLPDGTHSLAHNPFKVCDQRIYMFNRFLSCPCPNVLVALDKVLSFLQLFNLIVFVFDFTQQFGNKLTNLLLLISASQLDDLTLKRLHFSLPLCNSMQTSLLKSFSSSVAVFSVNNQHLDFMAFVQTYIEVALVLKSFHSRQKYFIFYRHVVKVFGRKGVVVA